MGSPSSRPQHPNIIAGLQEGIDNFTIKKVSTGPFGTPIFHVLDPGGRVKYTIKVKYKGWRSTRHVVVKDEHEHVLRTVVYDREASSSKLKYSVGDDGATYLQHCHYFSPDEFSLECLFHSNKEKFILSRDGSDFSGPVYRQLTSEKVAIIIERRRVFKNDEYSLKTNGTLPVENLLVLIGLIIAKKAEDSARRSNTAASGRR